MTAIRRLASITRQIIPGFCRRRRCCMDDQGKEGELEWESIIIDRQRKPTQRHPRLPANFLWPDHMHVYISTSLAPDMRYLMSVSSSSPALMPRVSLKDYLTRPAGKWKGP